MDMLHMNCVYALKICFKQINDNLAHMRESMTNDELCGYELIYLKIMKL